MTKSAADLVATGFPWINAEAAPCCGAAIDPDMPRNADCEYRCLSCGARLNRIRVRELGDLEVRFMTMAQLREYSAWRR